MAAFPYQHSLFLLDSVYLLPNTPIKMTASLEDGDSNNTSCFSSHYPPHDQPLQEALLYNNNVIIHETYNTSAFNSDNDPSELDYGDHVTQKAEISLVNKRKTRDDSSSCSSLSKGVKEVKPKKQKKSNNNGLKERFEKKRKSDKKEVTEESPSGYIHVRARRGQATDSHSLAERVRREKMSERMKLLQGLVPGCDKVTGKALMLDEIINYVQSLQYQVEFLSMKLASMNPILYDFGEDLDTHMIKTEKVRSLGSSPIPTIHQANPTQPTPFADTTATLTTRNNNYSVQDNALSSFLLQQGKLEMLNALSQDNENLLWDVEDQRQRLLNQCGVNNLCSFQ